MTMPGKTRRHSRQQTKPPAHAAFRFVGALWRAVAVGPMAGGGGVQVEGSCRLGDMQGMGQAMHAMADAKTPVERLDARIGMMDTRLAALKELKPALQGLYGALSAEQKKKADEVLTGMGCMM